MRLKPGARRGTAITSSFNDLFPLFVANSQLLTQSNGVCSHSVLRSSNIWIRRRPDIFLLNSCLSTSMQCAGEGDQSQMDEVFFMNARCSCGKDMKTGLFSCLRLHNRRDGLTNIYHLLVLFFFMILQSKFEQKEIWARKKAENIEANETRERERSWEWKFCANRRQVKSGMLHLLETLSSSCSAPSWKKRILERKKWIVWCYAIYGRIWRLFIAK